jgi:HEPN domain-containing protein
MGREPSQYYGQGDAQRCLSYAESILTAVKTYIENSSAS